MDLIKDANLSLKLFVELVSRESEGRKSRKDWDEIAQNLGDGVYREILLLLTQTEFEPQEARRLWFEILEHRERMGEALGRDPGVQVAVCDFFTNVQPTMKNLVMVDMQSLLQKERSAMMDELTGLFNRRYFNKILHREIETARRFDHQISLLMLDVDKFKVYNDTFGHPAGDRALCELADVLSQTARTIDHLTRYGGEEFVIILPRTDKDQAMSAAERFRQAVEAHYFQGQEMLPSGNLTITVGIATFPMDGEDGLELLSRADEALLLGKAGRNQVVAAHQEKRSHPRYSMVREMALRLINDAGEGQLTGRTEDISLGGVRCLVPRPVEVGRRLDVILTSPEDGEAVQLPARVVRLSGSPDGSNAFYLGLSFQDVSEEQNRTLRHIIPEASSPLQ